MIIIVTGNTPMMQFSWVTNNTLQEMIDKVAEVCIDSGVEVNANKTKTMIINKTGKVSKEVSKM